MRREHAASFLCGLLFVVGLGVAGMTDPNKVLAFLDVGGRFDPALVAVMASAVGLGGFGFRLVLRRARPRLAARFHMPTQTRVDARLVVGAVLFGVGWGLSGYCPGPALAAVVTGGAGALTFVAAMFAGFGLHAWFRRRTGHAEPSSESSTEASRLSETPAE